MVEPEGEWSTIFHVYKAPTQDTCLGIECPGQSGKSRSVLRPIFPAVGVRMLSEVVVDSWVDSILRCRARARSPKLKRKKPETPNPSSNP